MFRRDDKKFGDRRSAPTVMHDAVCAECGNDCKVPFVPTGRRPVLCRDCFRANEEGVDFEPRERSREMPSAFDKDSFPGKCDSCGEDCFVPFKPIKGKPLYCQRCLGKVNAEKSLDLSKSQYEVLNTKLDKILKLLGDKSVDFEEKPFYDRKPYSKAKHRA